MANSPNQPAAQCRPDQLFGAWAIDGEQFAQMVEIARDANLEQLRAEAAASAGSAGQRPLYTVDSDGRAVFEIAGPMTKYETSFQSLFGGTSTVRVRQALRAAARDPDVLGGMLVVDSPGGTVAGTSELATEIRNFAAKKPLFAHVDDGAASAALWAISGASRISANPGSSVGSIGAFATLRDTSGAYAQRGVKVHVISSAPPIKGAFVDGTEITSPQIAEAERQIKDIAAVFVSELAAGRKMSIETTRNLATGQVWIASKAKELGLIDDVATFDQAMAQLRRSIMNETTPASVPSSATPVSPETAATATVPVPAAETPAIATPVVEIAGISHEELTRLRERAAAADRLEGEQRTARFATLATELGLPASMAPALNRIESSVDAATFAELDAAFRGQAAQIAAAAAGLLTTHGTSNTAASDLSPTDQLAAIAEGLLKSGEARTKAASMALAAKKNPALYQAHLEAQRRR